MISRASDDQNQTEHGQMLSSNMLLLNLTLLIEVTFSTPTPDNNSCPKRVLMSDRAENFVSSEGSECCSIAIRNKTLRVAIEVSGVACN